MSRMVMLFVAATGKLFAIHIREGKGFKYMSCTKTISGIVFLCKS